MQSGVNKFPEKNQPQMNFYISQKTSMHTPFTLLLFTVFNSNHLCYHVLLNTVIFWQKKTDTKMYGNNTDWYCSYLLWL